jgi:hypothetical protein
MDERLRRFCSRSQGSHYRVFQFQPELSDLEEHIA